MRAFMQSGYIAELWRGCRSSAMRPRWVHYVQDGDEPLSWAEAHRRLQREGRRSRVSHRLEAQRRFEIREPRTGNGVMFK